MCVLVSLLVQVEGDLLLDKTELDMVLVLVAELDQELDLDPQENDVLEHWL